MSKIIGIDLGTSKSMAYEYDEKNNEFYSLTQDEVNGIPSIFCNSSVYGNQELVGSKAINCLTLEPENVVTSIKTKLLLPEIQVNQKSYSPNDILNQLVKEQLNEIKMKYQLNHFFSEEIQEAILTVPVSFGSEERTILKEAYENNHIKIREMIHEPVAAALVLKEKNIIVIDIGAGTLDMTALEFIQDEYKIKDVYGNNYAGDLFDQIFMDYLIQNGKLAKMSNPEDERIALYAVKEIKEKLSFHETWTSKVSLKHQDAILIDANREDLNQALNQEFDKICDSIQQFIQDNDSEDLHLLVTGRSSLIPAFQQKLKATIDNDIQVHFFDTNVIAKGAALYASKQINVKNSIIQYSYYLDVFINERQTLELLVPAKVNLPYSKTLYLRTRTPGGVTFNIYEVENRQDEYLDFDTDKKLIQEIVENKVDCPPKTEFRTYIYVDNNGIFTFKYDLLDDVKEQQIQI